MVSWKLCGTQKTLARMVWWFDRYFFVGETKTLPSVTSLIKVSTFPDCPGRFCLFSYVSSCAELLLFKTFHRHLFFAPKLTCKCRRIPVKNFHVDGNLEKVVANVILELVFWPVKNCRLFLQVIVFNRNDKTNLGRSLWSNLSLSLSLIQSSKWKTNFGFDSTFCATGQKFNWNIPWELINNASRSTCDNSCRLGWRGCKGRVNHLQEGWGLWGWVMWNGLNNSTNEPCHMLPHQAGYGNIKNLQLLMIKYGHKL